MGGFLPTTKKARDVEVRETLLRFIPLPGVCDLIVRFQHTFRSTNIDLPAHALAWLDAETIISSRDCGSYGRKEVIEALDVKSRKATWMMHSFAPIFDFALLDNDGQVVMRMSDSLVVCGAKYTHTKTVVICEKGKRFHAMAALKGGRIVAATLDGDLHVYLASGQRVAALEAKTPNTMVRALACQGNSIFAGRQSGRITVLDARGGSKGELAELAELFELVGHTKPITSLFVRNEWLFSGSEDCTVRFWDLRENATVRVFSGHTTPISKVVAFGTNQAASCARGGTLYVWDVETGGRTLIESTAPIIALASCGARLACGTRDAICIF